MVRGKRSEAVEYPYSCKEQITGYGKVTASCNIIENALIESQSQSGVIAILAM
jgi:hypothetical protein